MACVRVPAIVVVYMIAFCLMMPGLSNAADGSVGIQGSSGPAAASALMQAQGSPNAIAYDKPTSNTLSDRGLVSLTVNPATAWQPRGGEVLIAARGDSTKFNNLSFLVCFGWNDGKAMNYFSSANLGQVTWEQGFVALGPTEQTGILNLGVTVPPLRPAPSAIWQRWGTGIRFKGFGFVPAADLRLIAYTKDGVLFDEVRPVGITSAFYALCFTTIGLSFAIEILYRLTVGQADMASTYSR